MQDPNTAAPLGPATQRPHPSNAVTLENLATVFTFHRADEQQRNNMAHLRARAMDLATAILHLCPPSADRSAAIRSVREALMTANAAIMLDGK